MAGSVPGPPNRQESQVIGLPDARRTGPCRQRSPHSLQAEVGELCRGEGQVGAPQAVGNLSLSDVVGHPVGGEQRRVTRAKVEAGPEMKRHGYDTKPVGDQVPLGVSEGLFLVHETPL